MHRTPVHTGCWLHGRRSGRRGVDATGAGARVAVVAFTPHNGLCGQFQCMRSTPDGNVVSLGVTARSHDTQKSQMDQPGLFVGSGSRERQGAGAQEPGWVVNLGFPGVMRPTRPHAVAFHCHWGCSTCPGIPHRTHPTLQLVGIQPPSHHKAVKNHRSGGVGLNPRPFGAWK